MLPSQAEIDRQLIPKEPVLPETFLQQASQAAKYVEILDSGGGLEDPLIRSLLAYLGNSEYIVALHFPDVLTRVDPNVALPFWLKRDFLIHNGLVRPKDELLNEDQRTQAQTLYDNWIVEKRRGTRQEVKGRYDYITRTKSNVPPPRRFKMYVEQRDLLEVLENGSLDRVFTALISQNRQPHSMKLYDGDRLVWYFNLDMDQSQNIEGILQSQNVNYRLGQDVYRAWASDKDDLSINVFTSNDDSFRHHYRVARYSREEFLKDYLLLCSKVGKNPATPYLTSFIHLYDLRTDKEKPEELIWTAEAKAGYPVAYHSSLNEHEF